MILDKLCQIHGTPDKPANHTHRECWVFKQAGKLNAEHKGGRHQAKMRTNLASKALEDRKKFPPEVKIVNMIHVMKRRSKHALRDTHAIEPVTLGSTPGWPARSLLIAGIMRQASDMMDWLPWC